jgi:hypothetical protein
MITFGMQGMFPCWKNNLYFYQRKAFKRKVLEICEKEECIVEIMLSFHPYDMKDLTLMKKLTIQWMALLKMSLMDTCVIFLMMPIVMAL